MALQQFVAWLLGGVNNCRAGNPITCNHHWTRHQLTNTLYHSKGLDQRSGSNPFERSGSCVGTGLDPDLTFWAAAIYWYTQKVLLMEDILHQLVGNISNYVQGLYIPGDAGFLASTVSQYILSSVCWLIMGLTRLATLAKVTNATKPPDDPPVEVLELYQSGAF